MRKELSQMEIIDKYLNNELSQTEKTDFEKKLTTDKNLQNEVRLQEEIMQGIKRNSIKQIATKMYAKNNFMKKFKKFGLGGLVIAVAVVGSIFLYTKVFNPSSAKENAANELPELNEQGEKLWSDADKYLPVQNFELEGDKDAVVETKDGIVIAIPANAFIDANGKPVKGRIDLEVKEALNAADIMKAGLNTKSGDKLLETGGMFYINAKQDGVSLKIDPKNTPYAEIPANEVKPGMQLFEGKRMPDGTIDWVNPKPIEKDLIPVDITTLNFYPPNYLDSLKNWGYNIKDKKFTDSLYYSFAYYFSDEYYKGMIDHLFTEKKDSAYAATDTVKYESFCGINPSKIKTIWAKKYNNTNIATIEFEERLRLIHRIGDDYLLDLYVNNLDKSLYRIDSLIANGYGELKAYPEFLKFAARGDGKVKTDKKTVQLLKEYYQEKSKIYTEAISKTQNEFWAKQSQKDIEAWEKRNEQNNSEWSRMNDNFNKEYDLNITEAYRQLGKKRTVAPPPVTYGVPIITTGWKNVDAYVLESTINRTTLDYTDPENGKKAVIKYEQLTVTVNEYKKYDRVLVYLLPDELNSFMRVQNKNEVFTEKLNELMVYKMVCVAYKGEESFYYSQDNIKQGNVSVSLIKSSNADIQKNINQLSSRKQSKAMHDELNFIAFEKEEQKRKKYLVKINELTNKVRPVIFPCMSYVKTDSTKVESFFDY